MRFPARIVSLVLIMIACLAGALTSYAQLPTPSAPILVVNDSTSSDPYQGFVPELLTTEGLNEFQVAQLSQLTASFLTNYDVVVLPHLTLTSAQASMFQTYVTNGGTLVGFRPDLQLASVFGVSPKGTTLQEAWVKIDVTTAYATGLDASVMRFHGTADLYTLGSGSALATLYQNSTTATTSPAVVRNQFGNGQAVLFAYDLTQTIILIRQGNPAWAGYPNNHDGNNTLRASQMFMDLGSGQFWNDLGNGALNDVPQADEQMRLFGNAVVVTNAAKRPLPKLWYFPNQQRGLLLMTGDHHGDPLPNSTAEESAVHSFGGVFSEFMWNPFNVIDNTTANSFLASGDALGVHFDDTGEVDASGIGGSHATWAGMQTVMNTALTNFSGAYPTAPAPVTTRDHFLIWVSNNSVGAPDQVAQARLFQNFGIQLDTSYSSFPNRWGYMSGSGLPMKFLDTAAGTIIPVYEQATQFEDDVQDSNLAYSTQWTLAQAQTHYQKSLSDSMTKYNTVVTMLFHPDHWITQDTSGNGPYQAYGQSVLQYAQSSGVPMSSTASWLQFWLARTSTAVSNPAFSSNVLSFTATGAPAGLTLLVPNNSGTKTVLTMSVDGKTPPFTVGTYQGVAYASTVLGAGTHNISVTYAAGTATISGQITPSSASSATTLQLQQGGPGGQMLQTTQPASNGTYSFGPLPAGTYVVTPVSPSSSFTPASTTVTIATTNVTGVNFAVSAAVSGETLFTTQVPDLAGNTDGPYELGTVVQSGVQGYITAIRFWKDAAETGTHTGHVWTVNGQLLATVTFANETTSGWQTQALPTPILISPNTSYVTSVNSSATYVATISGLAGQIVNQDLSSVVGNNGLYGAPGLFPVNMFSNSNYFRDIVFVPMGFTVSGAVSPSSLGSGATVTLSGAANATATAGSNGSYTFTGLSNGTYLITPSSPELGFTPGSQVVTVSNASRSGVNFTAAQGFTLSGAITPASVGSGATVVLTGAASATTTADANGNYSFPGVVNGAYTVTPSKAGITFTPLSRNITISGANGTANFTASQTFSMSGTISPAATGTGTTVTISGAASGSATADSNGNYAINGLPSGTYTVTPSKTGVTFAPPSQTTVIATANDTGVNFVAQTGGGTAGTLGIDVSTSKDQGTISTTVVSSAFSTASTNELLLAFVSADFNSGTNTTVTGMAGGGLTWTLVLRTNVQSGTAEIWRAFAAAKLTNATVTATLSQKVTSSMTVMSFTGVDTTGTNGSGAIGATKSANARPGAPSANLTTTRNSSWVLGVGNDWDNAISRTLGANQTLVHQNLSSNGDTYWVQRQTATTPLSGTSVTINDTAPSTDRYDLSIVEVLPALGAAPSTFTISGTISPVAGGGGATVELNGPGSAMTTADGSGNYSFTGIANGAYTVTPTNTGYSFSPASVSVTVNNANATAPAITATQTFTISGALSPATSGSGSSITLSGPSSGATTADANGNYSFSGLANGSYTVTPSKAGVTFTPTSQGMTINNANATANFTAGTTFTISGTITPSSSSTGATVTLSGASSGATTVDGNGNYSFTGLGAGSYTVTPGKTGFLFSPASATVSITTTNATANFAIAPGLSISGTISPIASGAGVSLSLTGTALATTTADANGNYTFIGLVSGTYSVAPVSNAFTFNPPSATVVLSATSATGVNFAATETVPGQTLFTTQTPAATFTDGATNYELGTAFTSDAQGNILAIRFWKSISESGTHVGTIWSPTGQILTQVTFTNETPSGWQQQNLPTPLAIAANTAYVVSVGTTDTYYVATTGGLANQIVNQDLSTVVGNNGIFGPPGTFPTTSVQNNYFRDIIYSPTAFSVSGTISTPTQGAGATLAATGTAGSGSATADANGNFTFVPLPNGAYTITPTKPGFIFTPVSQNVTVNNGKVTGVTFTAIPVYTISGTISPAANGTGTTVSLTGPTTGTTTADANGNYSFTVQLNGAYTVTPSKTGFVITPTSSNVTVNSANVTANFTSAQLFTLSGTITPAANGSGATVTLSGTASATTTADSNGNYSFTLVNGSYTVTPAKTGFAFAPASASVTVSNANATANFVANQTFTITGTITPAASGNGTTVTLSGDASAATTADSNGNYSFTVINGNYTVTPAKTGFIFTPVNAPVTVNNANATAGFTAIPTFTISGTITPAATANGTVVTLGGASSATVTVNASGTYSFTGLVAGSYTVTPAKTAFVFTPPSANVTLTTANATANFTIAAQTFTVSGTITPAADGSGATVALTGAATGTTTADTNGNYTFSGLANGAYTVTPSKTGFAFTPGSMNVTVASANATANFTAAQTFTITGTITPAASGNGTTVTLSGTANATTTANSSGVYTFNGVIDGSYTVTPSKSGFTFSPTSASVTVNNANPAAANFTATGSSTAIAQDVSTSKDQGTASGTVVSPTFTTAGANELLLAFVSADNNTGTTTVSGVSGGGLTWTLVKRTNAQKGTAEIWKAFAAAKLTNISVTATLSQSVTSSMTVMAFTGVSASAPVGATGGGSGASGAQTASLTTTKANSWVVGVGTDWDNSTARTLGANQTMVHQYLSPNGDTYWVQRSTLSPAAGTVVTINDTAPTADRWDLSICEIVAGP